MGQRDLGEGERLYDWKVWLLTQNSADNFHALRQTIVSNEIYYAHTKKHNYNLYLNS